MDNLLQVSDLKKYYPVRSGLLGRVTKWVRAVDRVSFTIRPGETLGLVGESGCGKTTVGRSILQLIKPTGGSVNFEGFELVGMSERELLKRRTRMQIIFQDPYSSLNPRRVVLDLVGEGIAEHGIVKDLAAKKERVVALLERVGLSSQILYRYPHEFSGGQRQRIAIARAISLHPALLVCDEPVSALDVSIQAQIINLLIELRNELQMAYLFIAHDLGVVKHISHRIAVMYLGQIVELSPATELFEKPMHPYTAALLSAIPIPDPENRRQRIILTGEVDNTIDFSNGCCFAARCPMVMDQCRHQEPPVRFINPEHFVKCFRAGDANV
ncbi:MAG TPA: peptide ABC transporter substrate-binding protein [Firmicutes bacterium]|jgi:peptide/nickel transport system ATP-binding protein|nr:peptide ABC transporter substrate-binding protein [Bacillota bacterium]